MIASSDSWKSLQVHGSHSIVPAMAVAQTSPPSFPPATLGSNATGNLGHSLSRIHHIWSSKFFGKMELSWRDKTWLFVQYKNLEGISSSCVIVVGSFRRESMEGHWGIVSIGPSKMLDRLDRRETPENTATFAALLKECGNAKAVIEGKDVHLRIVNSRLGNSPFLNNLIIEMYGKCGAIHDARDVFEKMQKKNVYSWTAMITAYTHHKHFNEAIELFWRMHQEGVKPDKVIFVTIFKACSSPSALKEGRKIHNYFIQSKLESDILLATAIINMYGKGGSVEDAQTIFDKVEVRNVVTWNAMISAYAQHGPTKMALQLCLQIQWENIEPTRATFLSIFNAFTRPEFLAEGKLVHAYAYDSGLVDDRFVSNAILHMYGKCGNLECAVRVFDKIYEPDMVTWNAMISTYAEHGSSEEALELFRKMQAKLVTPDKVTFIGLIKACSTMGEGKLIHSCIMRCTMRSDLVLGTALVHMYGRCQSLDNAQIIFDVLPQRDVVSWNAIIAAFVDCGSSEAPLQLLWQMWKDHIVPNDVTFLNVLNGFESFDDLSKGKLIHACTIPCRFGTYTPIANALLNMYGKCGSLEDANRLFLGIQKDNVVPWNAMIGACEQNGQDKEALQLFQQMQDVNVKPDKVAYVTVLNSCSGLSTFPVAKMIHGCIVNSRYETDVVIGTALLNMYGKCELIEDARNIFNTIYPVNLVSWNAMITLYARHGFRKDAISLYTQLLWDGMKPNEVTCLSVLGTCKIPADLGDAKLLHSHILDGEFEVDVVVGNAIINMYGKCGSIEDALQIFKNKRKHNVVSWNAIIVSCCQHGNVSEARHLFQQMCEKGVKADNVTFSAILSACASTGLIAEGRMVHANTVVNQLDSDFIVCTALVNMYAKCKHVEDAVTIFNKMTQQDIVLWNSIMSAYLQHGCNKEVMLLFRQVLDQKMHLDAITFSIALSACTNLADVEEGRLVHDCIRINGALSNKLVATSLVNMYGKCGNLNDAREVFDTVNEKDIILCNAMITAYAQHGEADGVLHIFNEMQREGKTSNKFTFVSFLSACSHVGLVAEACHSFISVNVEHKSSLALEHCGCMIDLLGRAGELDLAEDFTTHMILEKDAAAWTSLLGACTNQGDLERAIRAGEQVLMLDPDDHGAYVLLSNTYAAVGRLDDLEKLKRLMDEHSLKDDDIFVVNEDNMQPFLAEHVSDLQLGRLYVELEELNS